MVAAVRTNWMGHGGALPLRRALLLSSSLSPSLSMAAEGSSAVCSQSLELEALSGLKQALSRELEKLEITTGEASQSCQPARLKATATEALLVLELQVGDQHHRRDDLHDLEAIALWVQTKLPSPSAAAP